MTRFDIIETKRLVLRRWREADREPFAELNGDPQTLVFFPSTLTRAESDAFVDRIEARFEARGYGLWALEVRETGQFIGFTGLAPMQQDVPGAGGTEIGWRLARHAWHRGYATEAALAARDVAFTGAGLPELWSMTAVLNTPSQVVMRRIGMTEAARFEHPRIPDGSPLKPHVVYHLASPGAGELLPVRNSASPVRSEGIFQLVRVTAVRCAAGRVPHQVHRDPRRRTPPRRLPALIGVTNPGGASSVRESLTRRDRSCECSPRELPGPWGGAWCPC